MEATTLHQYQRQLAECLRAKQPLSERVFEAFATVPRHPFLSTYYLHQPGTREWTRHEREESSVWYEAIYQDQALVTRVDEHGRTLSSSSQPAIMATMLEALDLQPGMRVLEIGTGTGYNAALLATLTGDPHLVTTIDIDPLAVEQACQALTQVVGEGIMVVQGNGAEGYSCNAPYDRILVTASSPVVSPAWAEQLTPDGLLVCVLQPPYAMLGGLLKARKQGDMLCGSIIHPASFMELRGEHYPKRSIQVDARAPLITSFHCDPEFFEPHLLREDPHFAFFLYYELPHLHVFQKPKRGELIFYQDTSPQGYLVFRQSPADLIEIRGDRACAYHLWKRLVSAYSLWQHCGRPSIIDYHFEMELANGRQWLSLRNDLGSLWIVTN